jgi:peptidoglycan/LPS O-acetylase OafA/YrhL
MQATITEAPPAGIPPVKPVSSRLDFLDALRGIAAMLVVIQHVGERYVAGIPGFAENWFNFGRFGVTIFFLVSGFVIPYAFEKENAVKSFWIKRFLRLYPLYWLSLGLTLIFHIEPADFLQSHHMARDALVNVTMLQGFVGIPNVSNPFWTLFIEMAFYITFTVWYVMKLHKKTVFWAWMGAAAFFGVSIFAPVVLGKHAPVTKVFCFLAILIGSVIYRNFKGQVSGRTMGLLMSAAVLLAGAGAYLNFFKFPSSEKISATSVFLSWAAAFLFFWLVFQLRAKPFPAFFLWLGRISYSLYLLHAVVLDTMPDLGNRVLGMGLVLGISLFVSALSFRYLERPCVSLGHRVATACGRSANY